MGYFLECGEVRAELLEKLFVKGSFPLQDAGFGGGDFCGEGFQFVAGEALAAGGEVLPQAVIGWYLIPGAGGNLYVVADVAVGGDFSGSGCPYAAVLCPRKAVMAGFGVSRRRLRARS